MNIRQLEAFHAVMETGSATRAGERLGITQPAISKLMKSLADECGFVLFQRRGGQLVPTREAQLLGLEVARLFSGSRRVAEFIQAIRTNQVGEVSLAAPPALATRYLPQILASEIRDLSDLHLQIMSRSSPQIIDLVAAGQLDIGLSSMAVDHPDIEVEHVRSFALVCLLPFGHPLGAKPALDIEDLREQPFISLPTGDCTFSNTSRAFKVNGVSVSRRIEAPHSETAALMVANGIGLTIVPPFAGIEFDAQRVLRRAIRPVEHLDIWMLKRRNRPISMAADMIRAQILRTLRAIDEEPLAQPSVSLASVSLAS
ncbi:LysR family transcriptional regulator [Ketogulonicigenium vulgare]|nr:LysR family transcriptional regulator [Ketogulonicigenium vulgare]AOZ53411.1 LysR family transcriptional regulator [Ketogulonicigenium vulgare]